MAFAQIIGKSFFRIPYTSHNATPSEKIRYIHSEMLLVSLVVMTLIAWGRNEIVVAIAAQLPIIAVISIIRL